jgi:hypothetical protein
VIVVGAVSGNFAASWPHAALGVIAAAGARGGKGIVFKGAERRLVARNLAVVRLL